MDAIATEAGMPPADLNDYQGVTGQPGVHTVGVNPDGDQDLIVEFRWNPVSEEDFTKIIIPGDATFQFDGPTTEDHKRRFPKHWELYKAGEDQLGDATRLEEVAWIDGALVLHLKATGIFTIEALATLSDSNMGNIGTGGSQLRDRARAFVEEKRQLAEAGKTAEMNKAQAETIAEMQAKLEQMQEQLNAGKGDDHGATFIFQTMTVTQLEEWAKKNAKPVLEELAAAGNKGEMVAILEQHLSKAE